MHSEEQHLPFKQTGTITIFSLGYQFCVWSRSDPLFRQNPWSGCNSGIDLVVAFEYTFFELCFWFFYIAPFESCQPNKFLLGWQDSKGAM